MPTHVESMRMPAAKAKDVTRPDRADHTLLAIIILAALALAGTIALLPSPEEKAAGLIAERRYDEAIQMLVSQDEQHGLNAYEGFMLSQLYVLAKQPDKAKGLLEAEASSQADNSWALRQLVMLYRQSGDFAGEATSLRRLYDGAGTPEEFQRLRVLYRLLGDKDGEASLLERAVALGHASGSDISRLDTLITRPANSSLSAVWTAGSGHFQSIGSTYETRVLAASAETTPSTISTE